MHKKLIASLLLLPVIVLLGLLAFGVASPVSAGPAAQETVIVPTVQVTLVPPDVNVTAVVPVTGSTPPGPNILTLLFYGFLGLLAIVLLVALFASANRTTYVRREGVTHEHHHDDLP